MLRGMRGDTSDHLYVERRCRFEFHCIVYPAYTPTRACLHVCLTLFARCDSESKSYASRIPLQVEEECRDCWGRHNREDSVTNSASRGELVRSRAPPLSHQSKFNERVNEKDDCRSQPSPQNSLSSSQSLRYQLPAHGVHNLSKRACTFLDTSRKTLSTCYCFISSQDGKPKYEGSARQS